MAGDQPLERQKVANFDGWHIPRTPNGVGGNLPVVRAELWFHPFLPASLQYLDVLARGDRPPFDPSDQSTPPSSNDELLMRSVVLVSRFLNSAKVRAGTPMHWLSLRGSALPSS